jgi:hypothetical protein
MSARCSPTCDPVHHAGYLGCSVCDAPAWPTDAAWLDDEQIVATYVPTCSHVMEQIIVVDGGEH